MSNLLVPVVFEDLNRLRYSSLDWYSFRVLGHVNWYHDGAEKGYAYYQFMLGDL